MMTPGRLLRRIGALFTADSRDAEVSEEMRFHIEMEAAKYRANGIDEASAIRMAQRNFGSFSRYRDEAHDSRGVRPIEDLFQDLRIGMRSLSRQRVHAAVAILTLSIGIGGTTAIFGAVYGALFAPLPYSDSERIMTLWQTNRNAASERDEVAPANFIDWRTRSRSFEHLAAAEPYSLDYVGSNGPERFQNAVVTEGFFEIVGAQPMLGRTFTAEEFTAGRNAVAIMSEQVWRTRFGADTAIIGKALVLDSIPMVIVGVMPRGVDLPRGEQFWTPKVFRPDELTARTSAYYTVVGKLRSGITPEAAQTEMQTIASALAAEYPTTNASTGALVVPLTEALFSESRSALLLLLGAVLFVLLISCANVASLQLAQAIRRRRELAIRSALGAGRGRLMRQLLTESMLLALLGGTASIAIAYWGISAIRAIAPENMPRVDSIELSMPVLLFALLTAVLTALIFGALPMLEAGRTQLSEAIGSGGGRSATSPRARRSLQRALVGAEVALAMVLLVGAGLLLRSFESLLSVDRGFNSENVTTVTLQAWNYYPTRDARIQFVSDAERRLGSLPDVEAVGITSSLPLSVPIGMERTSMLVEGQVDLPSDQRPVIHVASTTAGYFDAMQIPLRAGRKFDKTDNAAGTPVALVNESFVRRYFNGVSPLGKRVTFGFQSAPVARTIVGVVGDVRHDGLSSSPSPSVFVPHSQAATGALQFVVRSGSSEKAVQDIVRAELASMNGAMPLSEITSLEARLSNSLRERRFHLSLLGAFSLTALLLSAVGIYGMMSHLTSERTQEIGVRVAVGARAADVVGMVLRQGVLVAVVGVGIGAIGALALTRLMTSMLFQVTPLDPMTYALSIVVLLGVAVAATLIPARRAARVDPMTVLRTE